MLPLPPPPRDWQQKRGTLPDTSIGLRSPGPQRRATVTGSAETQWGTLLLRGLCWQGSQAGVSQPLSAGVALLQWEITLPLSFLKGKGKKAVTWRGDVMHHSPAAEL